MLAVDPRPEEEWNVCKPKGLEVMDAPLPNCARLFDFYSTVSWFQRFGKQYPKTAHYNGHHCMMDDHPEIRDAVTDAIAIVRSKHTHRALDYMAENPHDVSVATMRHKGAVRAPKRRGSGTKLVSLGWGLGRHPDTWAPDGEGLVLMICVANTVEHHREFLFTCPPLGLKYSVFTPNGTILIFHSDAYDMWEHESVRSRSQDGECISLTVRIKSIDAYYGWTTNVPQLDAETRSKRRRNDTTSVGYARLMQHRRIQNVTRIGEW